MSELKLLNAKLLIVIFCNLQAIFIDLSSMMIMMI